MDHRNSCVLPNGTLRDALQALDRGSVGIALVVSDDGRLSGVMTDGDVRRALLSGRNLESPISAHVTREFAFVGRDADRAQVLDLMHARGIQQIPIVDADSKLLGVHLLHEIVGAAPRPNWAVLMAGGRGSRLGALTKSVPKPMLRVAGRPILERIVLSLVGHGVRRIFLSVNYLSHVVEEHFGDGAKLGCRIEYLREDTPLGTGGALSLLPERPSHPLLVMNGDLVTQADYGAMFAFHAEGGYSATMAVRRYLHDVPFGCVETEGARIKRFEEKPTVSFLINAGIYVIEPALLERVPRDQDFPLPALLAGCLTETRGVGAFEIGGEWVDVGQKEQLDRARGETG